MFARIVLLLAIFLAVLPLVHHHGPVPHHEQSCGHEGGKGEEGHSERSCILATLQKSTTVDAFLPTITEPERLNEPTIEALGAEPLASQPAGTLSPRAPPTS